jgi:hypothetical protein
MAGANRIAGLPRVFQYTATGNNPMRQLVHADDDSDRSTRRTGSQGTRGDVQWLRFALSIPV